MSWRPRVNISWRWIIRGTCLGLLGLCVVVWSLSYYYGANVAYIGTPTVVLEVGGGLLTGTYSDPSHFSAWLPAGWSAQYRAVDSPSTLHLLDGGFLGFSVGPGPWRSWTNWSVDIPVWFPTVLLGFVSWVAWRKTGRGGAARGFPVEPVGSRRESAGG